MCNRIFFDDNFVLRILVTYLTWTEGYSFSFCAARTGNWRCELVAGDGVNIVCSFFWGNWETASTMRHLCESPTNKSIWGTHSEQDTFMAP